MRFEISADRKENAFAVALVCAPEFPGRRPCRPGVKRVIVVAPNDDWGRRGFITLTKDEKEMISDRLVEMEAPVGTWFWCQDFGKERVATHPVTGSQHTVPTIKTETVPAKPIEGLVFCAGCGTALGYGDDTAPVDV